MKKYVKKELILDRIRKPEIGPRKLRKSLESPAIIGFSPIFEAGGPKPRFWSTTDSVSFVKFWLKIQTRENGKMGLKSMLA